jgi:hypothetical protein
MGVVLEYLEERFVVRPEATEDAADSTAGGSVHGLVVEAGIQGTGERLRDGDEGMGAPGGVLEIACVRVLGCFLAQMPEAFAGRVRSLLEPMICQGGTEVTSVGFLLPFLRQACPPAHVLSQHPSEPPACRSVAP